MIFTTHDCSREEIERRLTISIKRNVEHLKHYRARAVDAMTWKQFQVYSITGVFQGKSMRVRRWLDLMATTELEIKRDRMELDKLLSFSVINGERSRWLPSNRSTACLKLVKP